MSEEKLGPVATKVLFENEDVKVWEMNVGPGEYCGLHRHTMDYVLYIVEGADLVVQEPGDKSYPFIAKDRSVYYIPAGGVESFQNVSKDHAFREALFELKRPPTSAHSRAAFTICEALAGSPPQPGLVRILENDRIRVSEAVLEPNQTGDLGLRSHDEAVFVLQGSKVRTVEEKDGRENVREEQRPTKAVYWQPGGVKRNLVNLGPNVYRQVSVELLAAPMMVR